MLQLLANFFGISVKYDMYVSWKGVDGKWQIKATTTQDIGAEVMSIRVWVAWGEVGLCLSFNCCWAST